MSYKIVHCSIDEHGHISGGAAGDQTGRECCVRDYYKKDWTELLRYPDITIARQALAIAFALAESNLVGYNQSKRNDLYNVLDSMNWNVDKFLNSKIKTSADCSSFVYAVYCCLLKELRGQSNAPTTRTARQFYNKMGFDLYINKKYITNPDNFLEGDLINCSGHHIVMFGSLTSVPELAPASPVLKLPMKHPNVKVLQRDLNYVLGYHLEVDGEFGAKTMFALQMFQAKYGIEVDGIYGLQSYTKMREALNGK